MQIIRTIVWVLIAVILVAFMAINWVAVPVNIWPMADGGFLHFTWPIGFIAFISFALGLLPMWLLHKTAAWRLRRRIGTLENSVRAASVSTPVETALAPAVTTPTEPPLGTL